jgi:hypothetical protein
MAVSIDMDRRPANDAGVVVPCDPQDRNYRALNGPRSAPTQEPSPQPCLGRGRAILPPNYFITALMPSRVPRVQSTTKVQMQWNNVRRKTGAPYVRSISHNRKP